MIILVVDDLPTNRKFLVTLLRAQGYQLLEAGDGREGLAVVHAEHPDLVITDVLMPVMDGFEFVRQLRLDSVTRGVPVIFYTAHYGEREARALALSSGVSDVLTKPSTSQDVLQVVARVLAGESAHGKSPDALFTGAFDREHLRLLTDKVSETAEELRTANARLRALINIGLEFASKQDSGRRLQNVCTSACDLFRATYVTLGLLNRRERTVRHVVACGMDNEDWVKAGDAVPGIFAAVVDERRTVRGNNYGGTGAAELGLPVGHLEVHAYLAVPVASPTQVYGWMCLVGNEGRIFTDEDEQLVMALSGQVGRICEIESEVRERREAEDALRASERLNRNLVEHLPHRILVKDRHSVVLFCNANYARDFGRRPDEIIGTDTSALFPTPISDAYAADDREVMATGVTKDVEERYLAGGRERWVHTVKMPYRDEQAQVIGVLVVFEDITERKRLEELFRQSQKLEAIGRLAGGVAHDFNNLLTAILGYCEILLADPAIADVRQMDIVEIQKAGMSAARLTRQLLAFSRKQIIEPTVLDLNEIVADMQTMLGRLIGEDVTVVLRLEPELAHVMADRGQIEQILLNLTVNARDAMAAGGTLTMETANVECDAKLHLSVAGSCVRLTVTDTGTGMTSEVKARLFEPFFTTKPQGKGTGLGLATVHGIVTQNGGAIAVVSEVGRGTSFTVDFPRSTAAVAIADVPPPVCPPPHSPQTILVVEDADPLRELFRKLLQRQGYTVLVAADAEEALQVVEAHPSIDVVLTDVVMPVTSGPELIRQLHARHPALKVIYMSGYTEEAIVRHGIVDPEIAFLHKPFTSEMLEQKIREVVAQ
jgi:PAS domain S-box-containing protein